MKAIATKLDGVWLIECRVHEDKRGYFMESYSQRDFEKNGILATFVQDNISHSTKGTLRGLHYQLDPYAQGRFVRVIQGEVFDVAVDLRKGSKTFGQWVGYKLNGENKLGLYISPGFAHGFCVLSDEVVFMYKCTNFYNPEVEQHIIWNDPDIGIQWPIKPNLDLISEKDSKAPLLKDAQINY